ncbi:phage late control D family protein [Paractinoplanes globisporus]|uniref:Phage late control D family protein n=1 Tax=Paractinoplanes globisporus TaxID=113565 RepID=A0ABW6WAL8_9ACTN|nr:phage late control D family protein [Actinoplanes globisporus]
MTAPAVPIPLYQTRQPFYVPAFEVKVAGAPMPRSVVRDVIEVTYDDSVDKVDGFTLQVNNWDATKRNAPYFGPSATHPEVFEPGAEVQLLMGYRGAADDLRTMVTGQLTSVDVELTETAAPRITVRGLNQLDRFRRKQYTWAWPESGTGTIRDSDLAVALAGPPDEGSGRPGLGPHVRVRTDRAAALKETGHDYVFMNNMYPVVFLMERARRLGYTLVYEGLDTVTGDHQLYFGPSDRLRDQVYLLEWGMSLVSLKAAFSMGRQVKKVTVLGWDRKAKKSISESATLDADCADLNPDLHRFAAVADREEVVAGEPIYTTGEAKQRAVNVLRDLNRQMVTVTGVTVGLPDLRAGRVVYLSKVDPRIDGRYFVTTTTHVLNDMGYRTTFTARREDDGRGASGGRGATGGAR